MQRPLRQMNQGGLPLHAGQQCSVMRPLADTRHAERLLAALHALFWLPRMRPSRQVVGRVTGGLHEALGQSWFSRTPHPRSSIFGTTREPHVDGSRDTVRPEHAFCASEQSTQSRVEALSCVRTDSGEAGCRARAEVFLDLAGVQSGPVIVFEDNDGCLLVAERLGDVFVRDGILFDIYFGVGDASDFELSFGAVTCATFRL